MLDNTRDKAERRLKKVKIGLMRNAKFAMWSGIMMVGKTSVVDDVPTACTNGRDEMYGRAFIGSLEDKELGFVVLHENLHKAFRHLTTWRKLYDENPKLANAACDYVINLMIAKTDPSEEVVAVPRKEGKVYGLLDVRFDNMNAKQVFDLLKQEQEEGGAESGEGGEGGEGGFDEHDWEGAKELSQPEQEQLVKEIDQALRQGQIAHQKLHGNDTGGMSRELGDLLNPQIDWREALQEFVKSVCNAKDASSWRRVNRRFLSEGIYMPSLVGERVERLVVGVDTSGSVGGSELTLFLSEVKAIAEQVHPSHIDLIYWGSHIAAHEEYDITDVPNIVSSTKPACGGGTDPTCLSEYLTKNNINAECIVMLTDGHVPNWGSNWNAPILWVLSNRDSSVTADCGKTVHIKE